MSTRDRAAQVGVFLGSLALYLATLPSAGYNSDVYEFIGAVRAGEPPGLFHVHHLLFNATGWIWTRLWTALGSTARLDLLLRSMSALLGAVTVLGFYRLLRRFVDAVSDRLLASACFASCFAIWMFSVDVEVYIPSTMFLVFALTVLWREGDSASLGRATLAGLLLGASALYHQMGVLFSPVAVLTIASSPGSRRRRIVAGAACLGVGALVSLLPYVFVGAVLHGVRSFPDFVVWVLGYSLRGYGEGLHLRALPMAVVGQGRSLVFFEYALRALQRRELPTLAPIGLVLVAAALAFGIGAWGALVGWRRAAAERDLRPVWRALLAWYLIYAGFTLWWEPENPEFWVTAMVPFVALWAGGLTLAGGRWRWALVAALAIMIPSNLTDLLARRDPGYDPEIRAVRKIAARVGSDAVILPPSFVRRAQIFAPELRAINLYRVFQEAGATESAALPELRRRIRSERDAGRRVYVYAEAVSHRMRSIFPGADAAVEALDDSYRREPRFEVVLPYDPSGAFGTLARPRPIVVYELLPPEPEPGPR